MKVHTRMVIETDPEIRHMVDQMKLRSGRSIKEIIETLVREEYQRFETNEKKC